MASRRGMWLFVFLPLKPSQAETASLKLQIGIVIQYYAFYLLCSFAWCAFTINSVYDDEYILQLIAVDSSLLSTASAAQVASRVADRFAGFHSSLEEGKLQRRQEEESKLIAVRDRVQKCEQMVTSETKKRQEQVRALQTTFESKLISAIEGLQAELRERVEPLTAAIEQLASRVSTLEAAVEEQRHRSTTELDQTTAAIVRQVSDVQASIDLERTARLERETFVVKKFGDEVFKLQDRIDAEKVCNTRVE